MFNKSILIISVVTVFVGIWTILLTFPDSIFKQHLALCRRSACETAPWEAAFHTSLPMFYINLNESVDRRKYMEGTYSSAGTLVRVPAVNGKDKVLLASLVAPPKNSEDTSEVSLKRLLNAAKPGEVALTFSHFRAVERAYNSGAEAAIIFEDDASPLMGGRLWIKSLVEVKEMAALEDPEWKIVRLQYTMGSDTDYQKAVQSLIDRKWQPHLLHDSPILYASVAYMISRKGMEEVIAKQVTVDGKYRCHLESGVPCVADYFLFSMFDNLSQVKRVLPPMFTYRLFEDSTGVRTGMVNAVSDHAQNHEQSIVQSLRLAYEAYETHGDISRSLSQGITLAQPRTAVSLWHISE